MFDYSNYSFNSKYFDHSNKLVAGQMKDETPGAAIEEFLGLKKMHSFLVDDNSEHKKKTVCIKTLLKKVTVNIKIFC